MEITGCQGKEEFMFIKKKYNNNKYLLVDPCSQKGSRIMTIGETD